VPLSARHLKIIFAPWPRFCGGPKGGQIGTVICDIVPRGFLGKEQEKEEVVLQSGVIEIFSYPACFLAHLSNTCIINDGSNFFLNQW
jgi:hypothetical protein